MREGQAQLIRREDYVAPAYWIRTVDLSFDLDARLDQRRARGQLRARGAGLGAVARFDLPGAWPPRNPRAPLLLDVDMADTDLARVAEALASAGGAPAVAWRVDTLQRPVFASYGDLSGDGVEDVVVSEFGNLTGRLAWHERLAGGGSRRHVLSDRPGALATAVRDVDGLEASVGIVTLDDIDVDRLGPRVIAAADELASRLR